MTTSTALSSTSPVPNATSAQLSLRVLTGADSPIPGGGTLETAVSGTVTSQSITAGATLVEGDLVPALGQPPQIGFVLEDQSGLRILDLTLEVTSFGEVLGDRIEIDVTALGIPSAQVSGLPFDPADYTWKLVGQAAWNEGNLELTYELVQEAVPTENFDTLASCRLSFVDDGGGAQHAIIKPKPSGVDVVVSQ